MSDPRPNHLSWRLVVLAGLVGLAFLGLIGRLAVIQIVNHDKYVEEAAATHYGANTLPAPRGAILDASGFPLATSIDTWDVYIDSFLWRNREKAEVAAQQIATELGLNSEALFLQGTAQENGDVIVRRQLPYSEGKRLQDKEIWGLRLIPSSERVYPEGNLAASLVGHVGLDSEGLWGVEADFDNVLRGKPGLLSAERDALGRPISFGGRTEREPVSGGDVQLTIDRFIQEMAEQRLQEAVAQYHARSGSIIVMEPFTGAILAMASVPAVGEAAVNLNDPDLANLVRNRAITDLYEPGSVMKTLTTAMAIDMGKVTPNSMYFDTGSVEIDDEHSIQNWDFSANGPTTVTEYLQKSLNTGSVWLSGLVGAQKFYDYLHAFGLGERTHTGLSGEAEGMMRLPDDPAWYPVDLATNSYGQGLAVTPLQMLTAVNVFANGGKLMRPYVVSQVATADDVRTFEPVEVRRPVSEATARTVAQLMFDVVNGVDWHGAYMANYQVAGKTGTTLVSIPTGYDLDTTIASFAGFLPYEQPRVSILVKLDQPGGGLNLGGQVAAPVFAKIAQDIMEYLDVPESGAATAAAR